MATSLDEISGFLKVLKLPTTKVPTVQEVRSKYRQLLVLHPDKSGPASTEEFQKITEAVRNIIEFLAQHTEEVVSDVREEEHEHMKDKDDMDLLKNLEKGGTLKQNKDNSVTIIIEDSDCSAWMILLERRLGPRVPLGDGSGSSFKMKATDWRIPYISCKTGVGYGTVCASIWIKPASGSSKVRIQGTAAIAFVMFAIPAIMRKVRDNVDLALDMYCHWGEGAVNFKS